MSGVKDATWLITEKSLFAEKENTQRGNKGEDGIQKKEIWDNSMWVLKFWGCWKVHFFQYAMFLLWLLIFWYMEFFFSLWLDEQQYNKWFTALYNLCVMKVGT